MFEYCHRCQRDFASEHASQQHFRDSSSHWQCPVCYFDGDSKGARIGHYRDSGHRIWCDGCDRAYVPGSHYYDHVRDENVCTICDEHFESPSNLDNHKITHLQPNIECYGCNQTFRTYGGMIIHLESGACGSSDDITDLNESAAMCYQWKAFVHDAYRNDLIQRRNLENEYLGSVHPFKCPECSFDFTKLSGLFQHVESKACNQRLDEGKIAKLVRYLENRHKRD